MAEKIGVLLDEHQVEARIAVIAEQLSQEYAGRTVHMIGRWVENGEYPADMAVLGGLVRDICNRNAVRYFRLEE